MLNVFARVQYKHNTLNLFLKSPHIMSLSNFTDFADLLTNYKLMYKKTNNNVLYLINSVINNVTVEF